VTKQLIFSHIKLFLGNNFKQHGCPSAVDIKKGAVNPADIPVRSLVKTTSTPSNALHNSIFIPDITIPPARLLDKYSGTRPPG
jgi:hypothetical protein